MIQFFVILLYRYSV